MLSINIPQNPRWSSGGDQVTADLNHVSWGGVAPSLSASKYSSRTRVPNHKIVPWRQCAMDVGSVSLVASLSRCLTAYLCSLAAHWSVSLLFDRAFCSLGSIFGSLVSLSAHWSASQLIGLSFCSLVCFTVHWSDSLLIGLYHCSLVCITAHWSVSLLTAASLTNRLLTGLVNKDDKITIDVFSYPRTSCLLHGFPHIGGGPQIILWQSIRRESRI